ILFHPPPHSSIYTLSLHDALPIYIPLTDCVLVAGSNIGECFPILTDYLWRARDNGATLIVIDPRLTPVARTADLFLPVRPGRDSALMNGILHVLIARDWIDHDFIAAHTVGF